MTQKDDLRFLPMTAETVHAAAELAKECFSAPWSEAAYRRDLDDPQSAAFVCVAGEQVIGLIHCSFVLDELTLNTLAVAEPFRRLGIARKLWHTASAHFHGICSVCYLEVRESNLPARRLYESLGFVQNGYRPRYYSQPEEAAVLMCAELQ